MSPGSHVAIVNEIIHVTCCCERLLGYFNIAPVKSFYVYRYFTFLLLWLGYRLDGRGVGVRVPVEESFFPFHVSRPVLRPAQPPIQWILKVLSSGVKRPGVEADHSPPTNAEIKNTYVYLCIHSPIGFYGVVLNWLNIGTILAFYFLPI
jgi:hypothetical protein